nr:NAD(P)H-dependent oxidoreductase [Nocardioides ochotonae]
MVVVAHPRPTSFVHALAEQAADAWRARGADVAVHDLYAEAFAPVAPAAETATVGLDVEAAVAASDDPVVRAHREALTRADHLVVAHPNWWGKPPAIMAGWLDRVVVPGVAYRLATGEGAPVCLLGLRSLLVLNTGDTPPEREVEVFGDPLDAVWRRCVGAYLGDPPTERLLAGPLAGSSAPQRERWLADVAAAVGRLAGP